MSEETQPTTTASGGSAGLAVVSMILGIVSIILALPGIGIFPYDAFVFGALAIVCAILHKSIKGKGMRTTGLVTGIVGIAIAAVVMLAFSGIRGAVNDVIEEGGKAVDGAQKALEDADKPGGLLDGAAKGLKDAGEALKK